MRTLIALLAFTLLGQQSSHRHTVFDSPVSATYRLRGTVAYSDTCCATTLNVTLVDRHTPSRFWTLADLAFDHEVSFKLERADVRSLVLSRSDPDYGFEQGRVKLFFDARSKRLLKRIDFATGQDLLFPNDVEARLLLGVSADGLALLRSHGILAARSADTADQILPEPFASHPLPQSTYQEFARARPKRVEDGYTEDTTTIEETVGPYQEEREGFWFGKTFYDGEGQTGVGGVGFVTRAGQYQMMRIPELADWSVSALLVEPDTVWIAAVNNPEGAPYSGGLIEYDRRSRRARVHPVADVITTMARADGALFLATTQGIDVLRGGAQLRYRSEPDINARTTVVIERLK